MNKKLSAQKSFATVSIMMLTLATVYPADLLLAQTNPTDARIAADQEAYRADMDALNQAQQLDQDISSCISSYNWALPTDPSQAATQAAQVLPPEEVPPPILNYDESVNDEAQMDPRNTFESGKKWGDFISIEDAADYLDDTYYGSDGASQQGGDIPNFLRQVGNLGGTIQDISRDYEDIDALVRDAGKLKNIKGFNDLLGSIKEVGGTFQNLKTDFGNLPSMIDNVSINFSGRVGDLSKTFSSLGKLSGSYDKMISGFGGVKDLMGSIGKVKNLSDLDGVFSQIGDLGGTFEQAVSGFSNVKGLLSNLGSFKDLSGLKVTLTGFGEIGGNINQLMSGFKDIKGVFGQLGNIGNLSELGGAFKGIGELGGSFSQLLGKGGAASQLFSSMKGLNLNGISGFVSNFGNLGGSATQLLSGFKDFGGLTSKLSSLGDIGQITGAFSSLADTAGGLGSLLGSSGGMSGALDMVGGILGGGGAQYVPVHETGQLLTITQTSDTNLGQSRDTLIKLCVHLKSVRRIQMAMEKQTFVTEPDLRRQAATKVENYKAELFGEDGMIKTSYIPSGRFSEPMDPAQTYGLTLNKSSQHPENLNEYKYDARDEGQGIFMDDLKNSTNIFKDVIAVKLTLEKNEGKDALSSTLSREEYDTLMGPDSSKMPTDSFWKSFTSMFDIDKANNPFTAYLHAKEELSRVQSETVAAAMDEYQAGGGFLPVRVCLEPTADGNYCRVWKTITPGRTVAQSVSDALKARLDEYIHPELGQIGDGNEPSAYEIETMTPSPGQGGGRTGGYPDNSIDDGQDNGDNTEEPSTDPMVKISANNITNGSRRIVWKSVNSSYCAASNDWLGSNDPIARSASIIRTKSQILPTNGEILTYIPLTFQMSWSKNNEPATELNVATTTNSTLSSLRYLWTVPAPSANTDSFAITVSDSRDVEGFTIKVGGTANPIQPLTSAGVIKMFEQQERINTSLTGTIYNRYKFTYLYAQNQIAIELKDTDVYSISCIAENGQTASDSSKK